MFNQGHHVGYANCKDLVQVLYPDLNLSHLPPFSMDVAKFIMEIHASALNPYQYTRSDTRRTYHGASSQAKDSPRGSGIIKDRLPITMESVEP